MSILRQSPRRRSGGMVRVLDEAVDGRRGDVAARRGSPLPSGVWCGDPFLFYNVTMDAAISLIVSLAVLVLGSVFAAAPRWGLRVVCRCARSYMREDLASDPVHVLAFRFYGLAAAGLGLYALWQTLKVL